MDAMKNEMEKWKINNNAIFSVWVYSLDNVEMSRGAKFRGGKLNIECDACCVYAAPKTMKIQTKTGNRNFPTLGWPTICLGFNSALVIDLAVGVI